MKILLFISFLLFFSLIFIVNDEANFCNDVNGEKPIPKNGVMVNHMNELNYYSQISI